MIEITKNNDAYYEGTVFQVKTGKEVIAIDDNHPTGAKRECKTESFVVAGPKTLGGGGYWDQSVADRKEFVADRKK